jgi:putative ABC transport system permease protein
MLSLVMRDYMGRSHAATTHAIRKDIKPMFLALREFRHSRLRYALITGVIVMVSALVFILSGLANGLSNGNSEALAAIDADGIVVSSGSEYQLDRSSLPVSEVETVAGIDGVEEAEPFGASSINVTRSGSDDVIGISVLGIQPGGFLDPGANDGEALGTVRNGIVIDESMVNEGIEIGDVLVTDPGKVELEVVGTTSGRQYRLIPTALMPVALWQDLRPENGDAVSAIVVNGDSAAIGTIPDQLDGTMIATSSDLIDNLPGQTEQQGTLILIQVFLVVIAAGIIAAFFFIITLQKMPELGVMKAIGTRTSYLAGTLLFQVAILGVIGIVIGIAIACVMDIFIGGAVPFALVWQSMAVYGGILLVVGMLGTLLSLFRIARVDALDAINNAG